MKNNRKIVSIGVQTYTLEFDAFDEDCNIDDLLKIDYSNLLGELVTFPVIVNRFGMMLAEAENEVNEKKLTLEIYEAKLKDKLRQKIMEELGKTPTVEVLNNAITLEPGYQAMKRAHFKAIKNRDYLNSVFWSLKDKSGKLDKLSLTVQNGDIPEGIIEGRVNNVLIKKSRKLIADPE